MVVCRTIIMLIVNDDERNYKYDGTDEPKRSIFYSCHVGSLSARFDRAGESTGYGAALDADQS